MLRKFAKEFELKINLKNIDIMYQPPPVSHDFGQNIQTESLVPTQISKFKYQGSTVTSNNWLDTD